MHISNLIKICPYVLKILSRHKILAYIKGHKSSTNVLKIMCMNSNLDLVNIYAYIKFGENLSMYSQVIERKRNFSVIQGP